MPLHSDPAESGWLRCFYRDWRPTRFGRLWNRCWAWLAGHGLVPQIVVSLQTRDRRSGALSERPLVPCEYEGRQYVVSMLGDGSEWVQDVRASGGAAAIKRVATRQVRLVEVPPENRAPILKTWCQIATSGRKHIPVPYDAPIADFEAIAGQYPVFQVDSA
jgi:hypothetical protein